MASLELVDFPPPPIRPYTKAELAALYGVHRNTLTSWMNRFPDEFAQTGYRKRVRILTPVQVKLLYALVGTP